MNDKLKFYRSTLVQMTKGLIGYTPMHKLAEDAGKITEEIMKKVDEFENSFNYQTQVNENSTITANYPNFFKGVNPDYFKTEPMGTIVDNGPQYQPNQKPYGTLGEHWKELMDLFEIKSCLDNWHDFFKVSIDNYKNKRNFTVYLNQSFYEKIKPIADNLGIEFIEDFVKACEKCEE